MLTWDLHTLPAIELLKLIFRYVSFEESIKEVKNLRHRKHLDHLIYLQNLLKDLSSYFLYSSFTTHCQAPKKELFAYQRVAMKNLGTY